MPNWKKLIISGSDASLNSLTASNGVFGTSSWARTSSANIIGIYTGSTATPLVTGLNSLRIAGSVTTNTDASGNVTMSIAGGGGSVAYQYTASNSTLTSTSATYVSFPAYTITPIGTSTTNVTAQIYITNGANTATRTFLVKLGNNSYTYTTGTYTAQVAFMPIIITASISANTPLQISQSGGTTANGGSAISTIRQIYVMKST